MFEEGVKYNGPIPQIKYLPTHMIEHSGDAGEVRHVSDEVAKNMDFSTPVQATAFRYGRDHDEFEPSVNISDGHHRLAAAKQTGRPHLPVEIIARNAKGEKLNAMKALSDEIEKKLAHKAIGGGTFSGAKTPAPQQLARVADKFIYHSGTVDQLDDMKWGLEPQHGDWIKEMSRHAGDIEPDELLEQSTPLVWMSDKPSWVAMKVARKLGKHPHDITDDEIRQHGHVAMIPRKGDHAEHIWHVGDEGLSNGEYSPVTNLKGETKKAGWTDLYDHDDRKQPFGVERNEYVSAQPVEPMFHLTGQDLVDFLHASGNRPKKTNGGDVDGITAYHGSPHDFDQFDTSKIGTGEGNQSYGHGLYFAEAEPTAIKYRDRLAHQGAIDLEQESHQRGIPLSREAQIELRRQAKSDADAATAAKRMQYASIEARPLPQEKLSDLIDIYRKSTKGHMYEVHIDAHPDHFLNWDKPLSEQHPNVQKFLSKSPYPPKEDQSIGAWLKPLLRDSQGMPEYWSYDMLKAGIPGIRYLDAGSRNAQGDPTHNYVVFDHNRVSVKRKYAQGGDVEAYGDGGSTHEPHQRAEEQGYSIKGYHFTRGQRAENIAKTGKFDPTRSFSPDEEATFFWTHPDAANEWAHIHGSGAYPNTPMGEDALNRRNPVIMPARINPGKHLDVNWLEHSKNLQSPENYNSQLMGNLINHAKRNGYDTMRIRNMGEGMSQPHDQLAVLNPAMIRSEFAQFDPARQHENDIGARKGGTIDRENVDYKKMPHSPIVEHVLGKISAPLPALDPHLMAATAGRRS